MQGYAGSEEVVGYCLKGRRQDAVVATKYGFRNGPSTPPYSAAEIDEAVTRSLRKMETDYIDILQVRVHSNCNDAVQMVCDGVIGVQATLLRTTATIVTKVIFKIKILLPEFIINKVTIMQLEYVLNKIRPFSLCS